MHATKRKRTVIFFADIVSFFIGLVGALFLRFDFSQDLFVAHIVPFSALFFLWLLVFFLFNLYEPDSYNPNPRTIGKLFLAFLVNFFLGVLFFYVMPDFGITPKSTLVLVVAASCVSVIGLRRLIYHFSRRGFSQKIGLYGTAFQKAESLIAQIKKDSHYQILETPVSSPTELFSLGILPDVLIVPEQLTASELTALATYTGTLVRIDIAHELFFSRVPLAFMTEEKALACMERRYAPWSVFARTAEIAVALLVILITLPLTLLAVPFVLADGGPLFIRQTRTGKNERPFVLYKFRSMKALSPDGSAETAGAMWATENDPRITWIGRVLRKTHIDEIPQMWNIVKGDLALVGPRAERPEFVEELKRQIPYYFVRHTVRPGFTGWAQIKYHYARTVNDSREKFEYDLFYIKHRSLLLDLGIVIKTVQIIFTH